MFFEDQHKKMAVTIDFIVYMNDNYELKKKRAKVITIIFTLQKIIGIYE